MIEIDIKEALKSEGETGIYSYEGLADLGSDISLKEPLKLHAEYCVADRRVSVRGTFSTVLRTVCDRCIADMEMEISEQFDEIFWPDGTQENEEYTYQGKTLSLDKMVYDAILLGLPHQLLCREDCRGICPQCGQNLNDKMCGCKSEDTDDSNPFAKLKGLF